jgi:UDP-N-acetylglucosamine 4,6-dehydratase
MFKSKTLLVTGGTGSFGNAVIKRFLDTDIRKIVVFSRDEKKQDDMRRKYQSDKLRFFIGDVRDIKSVESVVHGVDYVFHAAALKQVPSCEFFPVEAVRTNVLGTENVLTVCSREKVNKVVVLSTDKAVKPVNAMGMSKALMEKVMSAKAMQFRDLDMTISATRYGNVLASRGSVVPLFIEQVLSGKPLTITNPDMTRFLMTLEDAVELVLFAFDNANTGEILVKKAPASTIETLARAVLKLFKADNEIKIIGTRHGEKKHEVLLSEEELLRSEDMGDFYRVRPDSRNLNYEKYFDKGSANIESLEEYNSENTHRMDVDQTCELLLTVPYVKHMLDNWTTKK